jgi:hypothetical protein
MNVEFTGIQVRATREAKRTLIRNLVMKHKGFIEGKSIESAHRYVVHSDEMGVVAECKSLEAAKDALQSEKAKCHEWKVEPHLAIFRWSGNDWKPAVSLYELEETDVKKNPSQVTRFP